MKVNNIFREEKRAMEEYSRRDAHYPWNDWKLNIYHPRHPVGNLFHEHNRELLVEAVNNLQWDLSTMQILDVGCGYGAWLRNLVEIGAAPQNCVGIDLSDSRLSVARQKNMSIRWQRENVASMPFTDGSFDLVLQVLLFSSILDPVTRLSAAREIRRVLKTDGYILWIDLSGGKLLDLISISFADIIKYFPGYTVVHRKPVHPWYFRRLNGKLSWISRILYQLSKIGCESQLVVMSKS